MSEEDVLVLVFDGQYSELLFLKTLIESAGIETFLNSGQTEGGPLNAIYVKPEDADHARELVADFLQTGKRTDPW